MGWFLKLLGFRPKQEESSDSDNRIRLTVDMYGHDAGTVGVITDTRKSPCSGKLEYIVTFGSHRHRLYRSQFEYVN